MKYRVVTMDEVRTGDVIKSAAMRVPLRIRARSISSTAPWR